MTDVAAQMEALRTEGNALFSAKQFHDAIAKYTAALALAPGPVKSLSADVAKQCALLWSNRAACELQVNDNDAAVTDCSLALDVEPQNEKARYRRAQAHAALGNFTNAFQDVRLVLQLNPTNKAAIALARKIKDGVQQDVHGFQKALQTIDQSVQEGLASLVASHDTIDEAIRFLEAKCLSDLASLPQELDSKGGVAVIWRVVDKLLDYEAEATKNADKTVVLTTLAHASGLLSIAASATMEMAATVYLHGTPTVLHRLIALFHDEVAQEYQAESSTSACRMPLAGRKAVVKLCAFVFKHLMLNSDDDKDIRRVLAGIMDGLRSCDMHVQIAALDGILHFVSIPVKDEADALKAKKAAFATLAHEMGIFPLFHSKAAAAIEAGTTQDSADVFLSRLPLVFTQCLAQLEANENLLQKLVRDFCVSPVLVASPTERSHVNNATASCLLLSALFLSNSKLALWAVQQTANDGTAFLTRINELLSASRTSDDKRDRVRQLQETWVDCVASICGVENGTACVPPMLRLEIFKMLKASLDDQDLVLRASALSIQVKIAVVEKSLELETADGHFLMESVFEVLEKAHDFETRSVERQLFWSGASPKERGIEALSYIITMTSVKDAFVKRPKAITSVFHVDFAAPKKSSADHHAHVGYRSNVYYGIGYVLHHVLTSESALKKKQMEGMDLTPEQYEELQKALKQKSALDDGDSPEKVHDRVKRITASSDVLTTLVQLLKYSTTRSQNVVEMAALSALHASEVAEVRGKLVQCGVFQGLIPLSLPANVTPSSAPKTTKAARTHGTKISNAAAQAIAKILISTNPNLVQSTSLLSSIKPLLELCKGDLQLLQFEALMALTNIASVSDETKNRIVTEPQGLSTLQFLQFSEHELVRRAATEAICNLLPNEDVIEKVFLNEEKIRLWLAFASVEEEAEDFETARAAAGALAMVSQVPPVSWLMLNNGALAVFVRAASDSKHEETVHRALFALENMFETIANETSEAKKDEKDALLAQVKQHKPAVVKRVKEVVMKQFAQPTQETARSCLAALGRLVTL
ncbi:TPA: hypothetical protein N0F65_010612 [Lagenidium giganteum]|uniref:Protein unc-45 homolog B n=1 Tax=Lagenidium giganteum TaxID=4803 RepID=A0AAV2ZFS0_9STRA|nr:TPA: hypothetical protein N0F65_010612 [Lagenidium giganteum]